MRGLLFAGAAIAALSISGAAAAFPAIGLDTGPSVIITLNSDGSATLTNDTTVNATYDGSDDTYVGVVNNSGHNVGSIHITSSQNIFGFDGDGLTAYGQTGNALDTSGGYGGPSAYFTNIVFGPTSQSGDVNFIGGIADGGTNYFGLEEAIDAADFTAPITTTPGGAPEPASWALMLTGFFGMGAALRRRQTASVAA
jgi:hypothetical protein